MSLLQAFGCFPPQISAFLIDLEMKSVNVCDGARQVIGGCDIGLDHSAKRCSLLVGLGLLEHFDQLVIAFGYHSWVADNCVRRVNSKQIRGVAPQHFPQGQINPCRSVVPGQAIG